MITFVQVLDFIGTLAFAISGIRLASAKRFDLFGAYVVGVTTAIGGGTMRDVLLSQSPFWMDNAFYLLCSAFALLWVIVFRRFLVRQNNTWFLFDTIGLALFTVTGIEKTVAAGFPFWTAAHLPQGNLCLGLRVRRYGLLHLLPLGVRQRYLGHHVRCRGVGFAPACRQVPSQSARAQG